MTSMQNTDPMSRKQVILVVLGIVCASVVLYVFFPPELTGFVTNKPEVLSGQKQEYITSRFVKIGNVTVRNGSLSEIKIIEIQQEEKKTD
ncbi:MAG: hypothetical protein HY832_02915 [Candidatus Aenigmarchaeota archaeon]|nr:hypothetical protein [Candidatus Aenigmarchaeota archaeon]